MKNFKIRSWKDIQTIVIIVLVIFVLIGMATDFISWKLAMGAIKKRVPTNGVGSIALENASWDPLTWRGSLKGRVYLFSDEDLNVQTRSTTWNGKHIIMDGSLDGKIKGLSGIDIPLKMISDKDNPLIVSYGKTQIINASGSHNFEIWVYLLEKGHKKYIKKFEGYKAIDYPITPQIINTYRSQIDTENDMTQKDINWLCTFTHDTLHQYILSFFKNNKVPQLFVKPNIYAYRLDQEISGKNKWIKQYKEVWNNEREGACIGIIYKLDNKTYVRVVYNAWWIGCKGGGFIFNFWR